MIHWSRTSQGQNQPAPSSGGAGGAGAAGDAARGGGGAPPTPLPMTGQMAPPTLPTPPLVAPVSPDALALRWMTPAPVASRPFLVLVHYQSSNFT